MSQRSEARRQKAESRKWWPGVAFSATCHLLAVFCFLAGCTRATIRPQVPELITEASLSTPLTTISGGERLEYQIFWWGAPAGRAVLVSKDLPEEGLVELDFQARTNWHMELFYPVRVRLISWFDPRTRSPRRFEAYVRRRWKVHQSKIFFELDKGIANHKLPPGNNVTVPINPIVQDGISLVYYVRTLPFELGKTIPLTVAADGKNWELKAEVVQAHLIRIGKLGKWPAVQGEVELAYPVPFFHGAKARVWYSADRDRIPLLAKIWSRVGPVTVVLTRRSIEGGKELVPDAR